MSLEILQNIIWKLRELDCPVIANREDSWIKELLFTDSKCRPQLLEWFLLQIHDGISEEPSSIKLLNSPGEKSKNLFLSFCSLGFCKKGGRDLIKGCARKTDQLYFWMKLTDVLWEKHMTALALPKVSNVPLLHAISKEHIRSCSMLEQIVSSVNMKDLLVDRVQLLPPDVSEYSEELISSSVSALEMERLKIPTLEEVKSKVQKRGNTASSGKNVSPLSSLEESHQSHFEPAGSEEKIFKGKQLSSALSDLHNNCKKFDDAYLQLKPALKIPAEEGTDNGPAFERIYTMLKNLQTLLSEVHVAKEASPCLEKAIANHASFKADVKLKFPRSDLQDFISILQDSVNDLQKDCKKQRKPHFEHRK